MTTEPTMADRLIGMPVPMVSRDRENPRGLWPDLRIRTFDADDLHAPDHQNESGNNHQSERQI